MPFFRSDEQRLSSIESLHRSNYAGLSIGEKSLASSWGSDYLEKQQDPTSCFLGGSLTVDVDNPGDDGDGNGVVSDPSQAADPWSDEETSWY